MLVSVIIPAFNRAATIQRAVDSVLAQTWKEMEIIVVDDGSTDETQQVLARYGKRIRVISRKNGGASAARNTGIKAATGEIISFLDSDDEWLPRKTEQQVRLLQRYRTAGIVCCICNARMLFSAKEVTSFDVAGLHPKMGEGLWMNPAAVLVDRSLLFNQVACIRREALEESGNFREDLRIMEDYDLSLRLAVMGAWAFIAEPLVVWHQDAGTSLSRNITQLEKCEYALQILNNSSNFRQQRDRWGGRRLLHRRFLLRSKIKGFILSSELGRLRSFSGKLVLLGLKIYEAIYRRSPFSAWMKTLGVNAQP